MSRKLLKLVCQSDQGIWLVSLMTKFNLMELLGYDKRMAIKIPPN